MTTRSEKIRPGFTLVEVIVVITILSILFALAAGAVFRAQQTAYDMKAGTEIQQIAAGIENFKTRYGVSYMPSRLMLRNRISDYNVSIPLEKASKEFLLQMFPRIYQNVSNPSDPKANHGWAGPNPTDSLILNGSECLTFFLGGKNGLDGFATNPSWPWPAPNTRGSVSFEFETKRLVPSPFQAMPTPNALVYLDSFASGTNDQPYYYFSSYKTGNDYSSADAIWDPNTRGPIVINWPPASGVTGTLGPVCMLPFADSKFRHSNPRTFQLMSAGKDKQIGAFTPTQIGTTGNYVVVWENGELAYPSVTLGGGYVDNLCNFHPGKLGVPQ